jgi:hypothetical protein
MRRLTIVPLTLAAVALAGCSASVGTTTKIDPKKAEDLGRKVAGSGRIQLTSIKCPDGIEAKAGASFDCDITYADGATGTITLHETDDKGSVKTTGNDIHIKQK